MVELLDKFEEVILSRCNVVRKETGRNSDGYVSRYYVIDEDYLGLIIIDEHPIESSLTAAAFVASDQQRVKNSLISRRPMPENTRSQVLYQFRIQRKDDGGFKFFKNDETEYHTASAEDLVDEVVFRLADEIKMHIDASNNAQTGRNG